MTSLKLYKLLRDHAAIINRLAVALEEEKIDKIKAKDVAKAEVKVLVESLDQ